MSNTGATTTYMLSALFHAERRGNRVRITCSLLPGWAVYCTTMHEFVTCWKAAMAVFAETMGTLDREE